MKIFPHRSQHFVHNFYSWVFCSQNQAREKHATYFFMCGCRDVVKLSFHFRAVANLCLLPKNTKSFLTLCFSHDDHHGNMGESRLNIDNMFWFKFETYAEYYSRPTYGIDALNWI